jgi:hypothetical protein
VLPTLPVCAFTHFRAELHRHRTADDVVCIDAQYLCGLYAARTHLARTATPARQQGLEFFLSRLTVTSPGPGHTLARLRGVRPASCTAACSSIFPTIWKAPVGRV